MMPLNLADIGQPQIIKKIGGKVTEVNDTAVKVEMVRGFGTVAVPRRWVFTDVPLKEGLDAELYISCMHVTGKTEIPVESI